MNAQDKLEQELRRALRREDPPEGFADRVLARTRPALAPKTGLWERALGLMHVPAFRLAATAALFFAVVAGGIEYRQERLERAAGEAAKRQLMLALRITGSKLQYAQQKVNELNSQQQGPVIEEKAQ